MVTWIDMHKYDSFHHIFQHEGEHLDDLESRCSFFFSFTFLQLKNLGGAIFNSHLRIFRIPILILSVSKVFSVALTYL